MPRFEQAFILICLLSGIVYVSGMDCSLGSSSNFVEKTMKSCPGLFDSSEKSYCCYDWNQNFHCCTMEEFLTKNTATIIIPIVIGVLILVGLIGCCICCLCCKCCPWYRRRHQGTVYGTIRTPIIQIIEPQTNLPPRYPPCNQPAQNQHVPFPTQSTGVAAPPPYVNEEYAKQAPYNPAYAAQ